MKRLLLILLLVLLIAGSILAGTLASYSATVDLADGSTVAKEFIFLGDGTDSFAMNEPIGPAETINWPFKVKNHDGNLVTETDLYYKLTFHVTPTEGKSAIESLIVSVKDAEGKVLDSVTGTGTFDLYGEFLFAAIGQECDYTVEIHWPDGSNNDYLNGPEGLGNTIRVSAIASQLPFDIPDPEVPQDGIHVLYEATRVWGDGNFEFQITITNNMEETIEGWEINFRLDNDQITAIWAGAREDHDNLPTGTYRYYYPINYNKNISPGGSISFGGWATGTGTEPIKDVWVNGKTVSLTCEFNKSSWNNKEEERK
ncbi:MAG: sugar-binding protein [Firmicutes bacterium]|nr:sugar-binding protein [Bacillota bacterium]